jgi:hypothetical protein
VAAFALPRRFYRASRGERTAWMRCCPSSTCAASRGRLPEGTGCSAGERCAEPVTLGDRAAAGVGGRLRRLSKARPLHPALRLCLGRCRLSAGTDEAAGGHQRCTVHKTATVLDKLPKSVQPAAKADLRKVTTAATAITLSADKYGAKYEKAVACLLKDRDSLLTFSRLSIGVMSWLRQ